MPLVCDHCPLRRLPLFMPHSADELALVQKLKRGERELAPGAELIAEGATNAGLFTLLSGWAFRHKSLADGRRQILNFLLPGDFIGVQQRMGDGAAHGVTTLTEATVCVFERNSLWELHRQQPSMGFNITWLTAHEESLVDDNLLSAGRRSAEERVATALTLLYRRADALRTEADRAIEPPGVAFPLTQQHLADALGLSLAHTNRTLRGLAQRGLFEWSEGRLRLLNPAALKRVAELYGDGRPPVRPLI
jgi:CRP-like cAMP-binding protein